MPTLHWLTRDEDIVRAGQAPYRLLEAVPELSRGTTDTENMLIQGDNLEALKALLPYYAGRVKCIYIDPPYNTRSAFAHYDDSLEHSLWLAMMYPRLKLSREFLSEDASIWVTIDDHEGHYLKVLMDEVFGRLDRECRQPDIRQVELLEFARLVVVVLMERRKLSLDTLVYTKYRLAKALRKKIGACRRKAANANYQRCLFARDAPVETSFDFSFDFAPDHYPARWFYNGSYQFSKHYYHRVGELKSNGEEFECARALDMTPEVRYWVRNLEKRDDTSFRLPRAYNWFYPDFVALLDDGRVLVVEYKGEQLVDKTSEKEKASVGALWEAKSGGKTLFLIAEKSQDGADVSAQIRNKIKGR